MENLEFFEKFNESLRKISGNVIILMYFTTTNWKSKSKT